MSSSAVRGGGVGHGSPAEALRDAWVSSSSSSSSTRWLMRMLEEQAEPSVELAFGKLFFPGAEWLRHLAGFQQQLKTFEPRWASDAWVEARG